MAPLEVTEPRRISETEHSRVLLHDAIAYALSVGGSGFRERLCLVAGAAAGVTPRDATALAEALEAFHHASLLLDDLPCMDDAEERRGQPSAHIVFGENRAILAALALINRGYIGCWGTACRYPNRAAAASRLVSRAIGEAGILDGQDRDLHFSPSMGADEVRLIARLKTGLLLELVLMLPAVLSGRPFKELLLLRRLARCWGQLYQGIDDFKDLLIGQGRSGKTPYRDIAHQRPNLVQAMGPGAAAQELMGLTEAASRLIERLAAQHSGWAKLRPFQSEFRARGEFLERAVEAA